MFFYAIPVWTEKAGSMCQIKGVQTAGVVDEQVSMSVDKAGQAEKIDTAIRQQRYRMEMTHCRS